MLWEDALVECYLADDTLAEAVASVFAIDPNAVLIVNAIEDCVGQVDEDVLVLVELSALLE